MFLLDMGYRRKSCRDVSLHYHGAMVSGNEEGSYTETRQHRSFFFQILERRYTARTH